VENRGTRVGDHKSGLRGIRSIKKEEWKGFETWGEKFPGRINRKNLNKRKKTPVKNGVRRGEKKMTFKQTVKKPGKGGGCREQRKSCRRERL